MPMKDKRIHAVSLAACLLAFADADYGGMTAAGIAALIAAGLAVLSITAHMIMTRKKG